MALAGDDIPLSIGNSAEYLKHFHISAPMLGAVDNTTDIDHAAAATALKNIHYDGFVSIEMRPGDMNTNVDRVRVAVEFAQSIYK
jgi:sugar phosphate isomerase/epimerase